MKFSSTAALLGAAAPFAAAFPTAMYEAVQNDPELAARAAEIMERQAGADSATALFEAMPTFSESQRIDLSGYEWRAPGPNDLRGPCPGLNAFANHGLLPRNGYATIQQYIDVTQKIVGMGPNLATFLSVYAGAIDGNVVGWSMGGTPPPGVGGLFASNGNGLSGSHNKYEGDASPTRGDLYDPASGADDYSTFANQFQDLINYCPGGTVDIDCLTAFRSHRFDVQVQNNPYFFNGPFSGVLVQPAAYTFIYRFMANHSAENPIGELNYDVLKSWFGIEGENGSYVAKQGQERIPENWYRRSLTAPYETHYFLGDVVAAAALHPKFLSIGGNTGTTNSFSGVDVTNLTGGVFNSASLLSGNNLGCFAFQASKQATADLAAGLLQPVTDALTGALSGVLAPLSCPQLKSIDERQLKKFPGFQKS
ncbi:unnamed protein product [Zymoseptoria tritici ST99CH_3D7]|uniref:Heme haloperoxidase family profile domain-containing protein n=1 Tax=Zymoseptoria tritici (strain ST99CH_3D7) TaxID=1276538 RepID=A0A1X7RWG9_ZYMT9|nr:unnamed protein product [Zymoseptoria tritici ST99CH_3D7]